MHGCVHRCSCVTSQKEGLLLSMKSPGGPSTPLPCPPVTRLITGDGPLCLRPHTDCGSLTLYHEHRPRGHHTVGAQCTSVSPALSWELRKHDLFAPKSGRADLSLSHLMRNGLPESRPLSRVSSSPQRDHIDRVPAESLVHTLTHYHRILTTWWGTAVRPARLCCGNKEPSHFHSLPWVCLSLMTSPDGWEKTQTPCETLLATPAEGRRLWRVLVSDHMIKLRNTHVAFAHKSSARTSHMPPTTQVQRNTWKRKSINIPILHLGTWRLEAFPRARKGAARLGPYTFRSAAKSSPFSGTIWPPQGAVWS